MMSTTMRKPRTVAATAALALAALTGCSESTSDGAAAGVDAPPSSDAAAPSSSPDALSAFSDSFDDDHNGWGVPPTDTGSAQVVGGDFVWDSKQFEQRPHLLAATVGEAFDSGRLEMTDVQVAASFTPERGAAAVGVFCRESTDTDSDFQWYEFVVRDGYAAIRHADLGGNIETLADTDDAAVPTGSPASIMATCADQDDGTASLTLELNDDELLTTSVADPLGNGGAGLQGYDAAEGKADAPMKIVWHDFSVQPAG
jgi:hypothetical protein